MTERTPRILHCAECSQVCLDKTSNPWVMQHEYTVLGDRVVCSRCTGRVSSAQASIAAVQHMLNALREWQHNAG